MYFINGACHGVMYTDLYGCAYLVAYISLGQAEFIAMNNAPQKLGHMNLIKYGNKVACFIVDMHKVYPLNCFIGNRGG